MGQWPHRFKKKAGKAEAKNPKKRPLPGSMNKNEEKYSVYLDSRPDVIAWYFEPYTMRVGEVDGMQCTLKPDFKVVLQRSDMVTRVEWHEVKAFWKNQNRVHLEDDARVKLIAAVSRYPEEQFCIVYFNSNEGAWKEDRLEAINSAHHSYRSELDPSQSCTSALDPRYHLESYSPLDPPPLSR